MKTLLALALCSILFFSCSKDKTPAPAVTAKADTLSSGWSKVNIPGESYIEDIYFLDDLVGYVAGRSIHKTTDGGNTWITVANYSGLNITGTPNGNVFMVVPNIIYSSLNNGTTFEMTNINSSTQLNDIYFSDNNNGFVSGRASIFFTTDGGHVWNPVQPLTGLVISDNSTYSSLFFINDHTGWISEGNKLFYSNGTVNTWSESIFNSDMQSAGFITIYATSANIVYAAVNNGKIFKSIDGGIDFSLLTTFSSSAFSDVHFIDDNTGYVCNGRKVYKTSDGGASWQNVATLGEHMLEEIYFKDAGHGWACGDSTVLIYKQ